MDVKTPCMTFSESGQPTGGGPCAEFVKLRAALDASGIPAQARLDDKGPPLRITVERAREIMGMVEHG